ncbi:hypothetical protein WJX73_008166 [Symbiochloris irregularis]|uniref:Uncharacterized protein n=1 Tax=Symbiochloris irregularis TaxID=706552 RepID=A0AAW1NTU9_9CHLO
MMGTYACDPHIQCASQVAIGELVVVIWIFVRPIHFSQACLAHTLFLVCQLLASQDNHLGSKFYACSGHVGAALYGSALGGGVVSLARSPGSAYTGCLVVFSILFVSTASMIRCGPVPLPALVQGLGASILFGLVIYYGQDVWPAGQLWNTVVREIFSCSAIGALATVISVMLYPSLAGSECYAKMGAVAFGISKSIRGYSDHVFADDPTLAERDSFLFSDSQQGKEGSGGKPYKRKQRINQLAGTTLTLGGLYMHHKEPGHENLPGGQKPPPRFLPAPEDEDDEGEYLENLRRVTDPASVKNWPPPWPGLHPVQALRPLFMRMHMLLMFQVPCEPVWASRAGRIWVPKWMGMLGAAERLIQRVAALEILLEENYQVIRGGYLSKHFGHDPLPMLRQVLCQAASQCDRMGALIKARSKGQQLEEVPSNAKVGTSLQEAKQQVDGFVNQCTAYYWKNRISNINDNHDEDAMLRSLELRSVMFSFTLVLGILEATEGLQGAVNNAMAVPTDNPHAPKNQGSAQHSSVMDNPIWSWLIVPLKMITGLSIIMRLFGVLKSIPVVFSTRQKLFAKLKDRRIQYGIKHWAALSVALAIIIPLDSNFPAIPDTWFPVFAYFAVAICMVEKVETTFYRGIVRVAGTAAGGIFGYLLMLRVGLANNPYFLTAMLCVFDFLFGLLGPTTFRLFTVFALNSIGGTVLCQYLAYHEEGLRINGKIQPFNGQVASTAIGILICIAISDLFHPWYLSDHCLDAISQAYTTSLVQLKDYYDVFYTNAKEGITKQNVEAAKQKYNTTMSLQRIAGPLGGVQMSLAREQVGWNKGIMVLPPGVKEMLRLTLGMLDRLAAVELTMVTVPQSDVKGSAILFQMLLQPSHEAFQYTNNELIAIGDEVRAMMIGDRFVDKEALLQRLDALNTHRTKMRTRWQGFRAELHAASAREGDRLMSPAESRAFMSHMHTFLKALDRAHLIAVAAVREDAQSHDSILSWLWGPFGLWRRHSHKQRKRRPGPDSQHPKGPPAEV